MSSAAAQFVVLVFWYTQPPAHLQPPVFAVYLLTRTLGVWLLLRGALEMEARRPQLLRTRIVVPVVVVACVVGMAWITSRDRLGVVASAVMLVGFGAGAFVLARSREAGATWLAGALVLRTALAAAEEAAYFVWMMGPSVSGSYLTPANTILAARSTYDTAGEFLVVAGGLDESAVDGRVDALRAKLRAAPADALPIRFSYGVAPLPPGGDPDEAVRAADEAMYRAKPSGRRMAAGV